MISANAGKCPDKAALICLCRKMGYRELEHQPDDRGANLLVKSERYGILIVKLWDYPTPSCPASRQSRA